MTPGNRQFEIVGIHHLDTANDMTIRVRIFVRNNDTKSIASFETDFTIWQFDEINIPDRPEVHTVVGFAKEGK